MLMDPVNQRDHVLLDDVFLLVNFIADPLECPMMHMLRSNERRFISDVAIQASSQLLAFSCRAVGFSLTPRCIGQTVAVPAFEVSASTIKMATVRAATRADKIHRSAAIVIGTRMDEDALDNFLPFAFSSAPPLVVERQPIMLETQLDRIVAPVSVRPADRRFSPVPEDTFPAQRARIEAA